MTTGIHVEGLGIGHGNRYLMSGIEFSVASGELVGLLGVNGIGKSTLLRTLAGLRPALAGRVHVDGLSLTGLGAERRAKQVAIVLTGRPPMGQLDVETLVTLGRQPWTGRWGVLSGGDRDHVDRALHLAEVDHLRRKALNTCSDGECQKALIARALAQDTPVLLLDEPTAFLDPINRAAIVRMLRRIAHEEHKAVLFSTHDLQLAVDLCDRLLLMRLDAPIWIGTPAEALASGTLAHTFSGVGIRFGADGTHRYER